MRTETVTLRKQKREKILFSYSHLRNFYTECKLGSVLLQQTAPGYLAKGGA